LFLRVGSFGASSVSEVDGEGKEGEEAGAQAQKVAVYQGYLD